MKINGRVIHINGEKNLLEVLVAAGFAPEKVALEKNSALVRRADYGKTLVVDSDVLEVFSFTGGG